MNLSLRAKFMIISAIAFIAVGVLAIGAYHAIDQLESQGDAADISSKVAFNHMRGDMMHDAIRADVLKAILALKMADANAINEASTEVEEHATEFSTRLNENLKTELPENLHAELQDIAPQLQDYIRNGREIIALAKADHAAGTANAVAQMEKFNAAFGALEESQAKFSEDINKWSDELDAKGETIAKETDMMIYITSGLGILMVLLIPIVTQLMLFKPQGELISTMDKLARGNYKLTVPYTHKKDEIGHIAKALDVFKKQGEEKLRLEEEQVRNRENAEKEKRASMNRLAGDFETSVKHIVDTVASAATEMDATARSVVGRAKDSTGKLSELSMGINGTAQNVQTVASATEQLTASINEISGQMSRAAVITNEAVEKSNHANATATQLNEAAGKIGEVIGMINAIAGQINLLALNATIEAARAGDAGKGFAVVAAEVKNLANQTTKATQEIEGHIASIQGSVTGAVKAIQDISSTIGEINHISSSVSAAIEEQGAATREISRNVQEAAGVTQEVSANANGVMQSSADTGAAADQMVSASAELSRQAESLRSQVGIFIEKVRTA